MTNEMTMKLRALEHANGAAQRILCSAKYEDDALVARGMIWSAYLVLDMDIELGEDGAEGDLGDFVRCEGPRVQIAEMEPRAFEQAKEVAQAPLAASSGPMPREEPEKAKEAPPTPAPVAAPTPAPPTPAPKPANLPGARRFTPEQAATICRELWKAELEMSGEKKADVARRWNIGWSTVVKLQAGESYRETTAAVAEEYRALQAVMAGPSQGGANDGVTMYPVLCPEWIVKTKRMIEDGMLDLVDKVGKRLPLANGEKWVFGSLEELAAAIYSEDELRDETVRMRAGLGGV